jgi:hypothetical protein
MSGISPSPPSSSSSLQADVQLLEQKVAELQKCLVDLQQLQVNPQLPVKGIKVAPPDVFDGSQSKADTFLSQLSLYFMGRRKEFEQDDDKIIFALSYMKGGTAGPWAAEVLRQCQASGPTYQNWEAFLKDFQAAFGDPDPASTARFKMDQLKQGNHSVEEYVASFKELTFKTQYNDAALVEKFEKGLHSALVDKIYSLAEMPSNLTEWIAWATKLDRQWRQREARKKVSNPPTISKTFKNFSPSVKLTQPIKEPAVVPMEIDSGRKRLGPLICYKCRKPGHIAKNCQSNVDISVMDYEAIKALVLEDLKKDSDKKDF